MGKCSARHFVLTICTLQLVIVVECQVFDFMGFMYGPILANFFHIIFIIHGFFGALQYSTKYIISYSLWNVFWIGWTIFVICFYLDVGILDKNSDVLNFGTGSRSWWEIHGYGCVADFTSVVNGSSLEQDPDPSRPPKPTKVDGCLIEYQFVEVIQASMQCLLSILAVIGGMYMSKRYIEEDDSCQTKEAEGAPVASANYAYQAPRGHLDQYQQHHRADGYEARSVSPRPMTPRRVKRRSILARDTMNRSSLTHRRQGSSRSKSSQRRPRTHQNPVTRLLEQQNRFLDSSVLSTSFSDSNPINSTNQLSPEGGKSFENKRFKTGLSNPIFQQSSNSSINQSGADEMYRPNSARSSYSNYHASRPVSYLQNNEYFSNQAVAQVPINTNRNKMQQRRNETQNNLQSSSKNPTSLKSFSQKNFNFLGLNIKNSNSNMNNHNNNFNNNNAPYTPRNDSSIRNSKRFRVDLTRNTEAISNAFFSQGPPAYREGGLDSETVI